MTSDERAVRDVIDAWLRASGADDTETVLRLMTDDVVFLVPGRAPFGKEVFAKAQVGQADYRLEAKSDVCEVRVTGDWAYAWTHLTVAMTPKSGGPTVRRSRHTLSIFQRGIDGTWLLARDANMLAIES